MCFAEPAVGAGRCGGHTLYGMIHSGVRSMVVEKLGEGEWLRIERASRIGPADFIGLTVYDDVATFRIVEIAAAALNLPLSECLRAFGRHWISFADHGPFRSIMNFTGSDFVCFVSNLDRMHRAVSATMPDATLPSFTLSRSNDRYLTIYYRSEREGLQEFVIGLFEGLLDKFETKGIVSYKCKHGNGADEFIVTFE